MQRVIALLLGLAGLAEAACGRSRPVRWLALRLIGAGEAVAKDYVAALTGVAVSEWPAVMPVDVEGGVDQGVAEALRLALVFRALAAVLVTLLKRPFTQASLSNVADASAAFRILVAAFRVDICDSS